MLKKIGMPVSLPKKLAKERLIDIMKHDKKAINKWPRFVLIDKIGQVRCTRGQWANEVSPEVVEKVIDVLLSDRD